MKLLCMAAASKTAGDLEKTMKHDAGHDIQDSECSYPQKL